MFPDKKKIPIDTNCNFASDCTNLKLLRVEGFTTNDRKNYNPERFFEKDLIPFAKGPSGLILIESYFFSATTTALISFHSFWSK